ncbi:MAG: hypothetical protein HUJ75_08605 [Parasporobacterium sp.]|nr:hypothetical protein [Parasporobacterium sp.]
MATQEKLQYFYESALHSIKDYSDLELGKLEESLKQQFEDYKKQAEEDARLRTRLDCDTARRVLLKNFSAELLSLRKEETACRYSIRSKLFEEVEERLAAFRQSGSYAEMLAGCMKKAVEFAGDDEVIIYLDPEDAHLKEQLESQTGIALTISDFAFDGGMQAAVPSRNILIDFSFRSRMQDIRKTYRIPFKEA